MAIVKSSNEHLTLNADGSGNDIKFQSNGVEKASLTDGGVFTATSFAGSGANLTGISSVGGATGVDFNDNVKARFGTGADLEIFHDGSHSRIKDVGTGYLVLSGTEIHFNDSSNSNNRIKIDSTGAVTMPAQPAFQVASNTMQNNITVGGSPVTVVYGTEVFDQNSDFTSNTFTAPVTGKYQLSATTRLGTLDSASAYYMMRIVTSNREYKSIFDPDFGQDNGYWSVVITVLADMDAGDTATVKFLQNNGDAQTDIEGSVQYTYFSGYLAC